MRTVILAAGKSERFARAGFPKHKLLLPMPDGHTLLEWVVRAYDQDDYLLLLREEHLNSLKGTIARILARDMRDKSFVVARTNKETHGPLDTLWKFKEWLNHPHPFLLVYCDILPFSPAKVERLIGVGSDNADMRMVVFPSEDERFTDASKPGMKESGIFWVRSGTQLVNAMRYMKREDINGLPDVFAVYSDDKRAEYVFEGDEIVDLGVPRDYRSWMAEQGRPVDEDWRIYD